MTSQPPHGSAPYGRDTHHADVRRRRAGQAAAQEGLQVESPLEFSRGRLRLAPPEGLRELPVGATLAELVAAHNALVAELRAWFR